MKQRLLRYAWIPVVILLVAVLGGIVAARRSDGPRESKLSEFQDRLAQRQVKDATYLSRDSAVTGELADGTSYTVAVPKEYGDRTLTQAIIDADVDYKVGHPTRLTPRHHPRAVPAGAEVQV